MIHLGDITKMTPESTPVVDCITFGSPCQDLSIAGKRAGLAGERSGLFMEAVRVIKEMRLYSFGAYPKFAVWENVTGAFSSKKGEDFRAVLEELARIKEAGVSIPGPEKGKWAKAGFICGDGWSIAWRTFDAQYWGVPQRRRRIAVVLDLRGQCAGEVLFERKGVPGDSEPCVPSWQGIARNPAHGVAGYDYAAGEHNKAHTLKIRSGCEGGEKGALVQTEKSATLSTLQDQTLFCLQGNMIDRDVQQNGSGVSQGNAMFTLNATDRHGIACLLNDQGGGGSECGKGDVSPTLRAESHNHEPVLCVEQDAMFADLYNLNITGDVAATVTASTGRGADTAGPTVISRASGHTNAETYIDKAPTLTKVHDGPPVVFESHSQDARYKELKDVSCTCSAQWGTGGNNTPLVVDKTNCLSFEPGIASRDGGHVYNDIAGTLRAEPGDNRLTTCYRVETLPHNTEKALTPWEHQSRRVYTESGVFPALAAREHAGQNQQSVLQKLPQSWIVRRLTPTECERLQGFPDGWTDIGEWVDSKGKRHKAADSPRYKALGNSIALPQWWWLTCKMAKYLPEHATLGSLFDGIGGFPLVWETLHGKGTAVWASEIEEFPIAVTKKHFGGSDAIRQTNPAVGSGYKIRPLAGAAVCAERVLPAIGSAGTQP